MGGLTSVHWKQFEKFLLFVGCRLVREKGDHRIYRRDGLMRPIVIPKDSAIPVFIVRNNLRVLSMTVQEYLNIMKEL